MKKVILFLAAFSSLLTAQVTQQWMAVYNGPSGSIDSVRNLAVDNDRNVYVTGSSTSSNLLDYTTLKYNLNGQLLWEARYDGPGHFRDEAKWLAIDNSGNVYVTGSSRSGVQAGTEDFATLKYNSNGVQQWAAIYNGPANSTDAAVKVAVDISGNVYVTGYSYGTYIDYTTIKYNSNGVQQWVARYNGTGNSLDSPSALAVDNSGNVFVTGWSRSTTLYNSEDFLTIKYNSDGVEQWTARYNGPDNLIDAAASLTIDNSSNVLVTGYSLSASTQTDYVTIKYNSSGVQQWLAKYNNNSFNGSDIARMVITDNSGNAYVTGTSGTEYPLGYPNYVTIKYDSSGIEQWVSAYNGPGNAEDVPYSIALDFSGNVYVTGKTTVPGFFYDFATVKYNNNGTQLWEKRFNGASNMHDGATWLTVDDSGNVYIAGNSMCYTNYASDFVVIKYSQDSNTPVELSSFEGKVKNSSIELSWTTASEVNNRGFGVERKNAKWRMEDEKWEEIGFVNGNGTTTEKHSYSFTDENMAAGKCLYRLKQIDYDGSFEYSDIVEVEVGKIPTEFRLDQNYPNPFNPSTIIRYHLPVQNKVTLKVFNILGNEVITLVDEIKEAGIHEIEFTNNGNYSSGIYFYTMQTGDFFDTKKFILIK
ncbi:MAG: hypothetical protein A2W11_04660 [Ignavibacteria bacterium RBG_16_35_7]|nr:MAG: hypothetical protein A2W11_04660 [Ignavibacteria bacterium RBG_16_35_7]